MKRAKQRARQQRNFRREGVQSRQNGGRQRHAEQADEAVKKQLKELYAQYKGTKYTVVVFLSGKRDLYEDTRDLLLFNRRRAAERAVQARKAAGQ